MCKKCDEGVNEAHVAEPAEPEPEEVETHRCYHCDVDHPIDDMHWIDSQEEYVCNRCLHHYYSDCQDCETQCRRSWLTDGYCSNCWSDHYTNCDDCGCTVDRDDVHWDDGTPYCSDCYAPAGRHIHSYSMDVTERLEFLGAPADKIFYGIELEVECGQRSSRSEPAESVAADMEGYALLKDDGSLSNGFEIVTAPASMEVHQERFGAWLDTTPAKTLHLRSFDTSTCGLHIHVSRAPLTQLQIGKMQCFLHNTANQRLLNTIAQRDSNEYARRTYPKKVTDKPTDERYVALNLCNYSTVELRIFKGTLNKQSFMKSLEFTHALVNYTKTGVASIKDAVEGHKLLEWIQEPVRASTYKNLIAFLIKHNYPLRPVSKPNALLPVVAVNQEEYDGELQACA